MTDMTATLTRTRVPARSRPVTLARVVNAEWIKLRTVRSTGWTLLATVALMVGIAVLVAWGTTSGLDGEPLQTMSLAALVTSGRALAELTVAVLGVLAMTNEYTTGMIRSTFAAVPRRLSVLVAKAVVIGSVVAATALVGMVLSAAATLPFHDQLGATLDLSGGDTLRVLVGFPLYLMAIGLLGMAVGALLRRTAGAVAAVLALLLVVENVFALVPLRLFELVSPFLPASAGGRVLMDSETLAMVDATQGFHLTPWQGYGVLLAWVAVLAFAASELLRRRDA